MTAVLWWSGIGAGALAAIVLLLLAVPVDVRGRMEAEAEAALSWSVQIRWLFGLVRLERGAATASPVESAPERAEPGSAAKAEPGSAGGRRRRRGGRRMPRLLAEPAVWRRALHLLRSSLRGLTLRRVDARVRFGLDDPADTGRLYGLLAPALILLQSEMPGRVAVAPDFERAGLAARAAGDLRIVPLRVLAPIASFGVWLGVHTWRRRRR